jgi:hypothetical protein
VLTLAGEDVRPGHRGEFRVLVAARRTGLGQVRAYLAADILRRLSERSRLAPSVIDLAPHHEDELRAVCAELNIHPPRHTLTPSAGKDSLTGLFADGIREPVFDVGVRAAPAETATGVGGLARYWVEVADSDADTERPLREMLGVGEEPLLVRMMLMRHGYGEPAGDGGDDSGRGDSAGAAGAAAALGRWRELVARWARSPSGPMSKQYADAITAAFASDLDTAAALGELAALADDPGVPDGVKFETFAAADMLFGLDLARDVGR